MKTRKIARACLWAVPLAAVSLLLAACSSASTPAGTTVTNPRAASPAGSWPYPNGDLANTREAAGSTISSANVAGLQQAWTFRLPAALVTSGPGFGSLTGTPIVTDGVVYLQDLGDNVYALTLATGKLKWEYQLSPKIVEGGPNGVAVAGGVVYGDTMSTVFALSARTGKTIWVDKDLLNAGQGTFGIEPQVANGRVYLASSIGTGPGGGVLLALNASTGKQLWRFNTILHGSPTHLRNRWRLGDPAGRQRRLGDVRHRQSLSDGRAGDCPPVLMALHRQRGEPGRGDGQAALVLPGGAQ